MESIKKDAMNTIQAAEFLDLSERTLIRDRAKNNPDIPCKKIGGLYFYSKNELLEYWKSKRS